MFNSTLKTLLAGLALAASLGTYADVAPYAQVRLGNPIAPNAQYRHVAIVAGVHAVTVHDGDDVVFDVQGHEVAWHFDTIAADMAFDLADLAPAWVAPGQVHVTIEPVAH